MEAFGKAYGLDVTFTRLAVTPDQIEALVLPTAPAKAKDNRAFAGETCQAEAIAPDELARIVQEAIDECLDVDAYNDALARERSIRASLKRRL